MSTANARQRARQLRRHRDACLRHQVAGNLERRFEIGDGDLHGRRRRRDVRQWCAAADGGRGSAPRHAAAPTSDRVRGRRKTKRTRVITHGRVPLSLTSASGRVKRAVGCDESRCTDLRAEAREHRFEQVVRERVRVLAGREALRQADRRRAEHPYPQDVQRGGGVQSGGKLAALDARRDVGFGARGRLLEELEPLEVLAEARHRAVDEHQLEVLGMRLREFVEGPQPAAQPLRADRRRSSTAAITESASSRKPSSASAKKMSSLLGK